MKTIALPTDFSDCSKNSIPFAIAIAKIFGCDIQLIHALNLTGVAMTSDNARVVMSEMERAEQNAKEELNSLKEQIALSEVPCTTQLLELKLATSLQDHLEELNPEMVVMGTTGNSGIENKIMGSTTYKVIKKTKFPVLAVPQEANYRDFKTIVFTSDFKSEDVSNFKIVNTIGDYFKSEIHVVHVATGAFSDETEKSLMNYLKDELPKGKNTSGLKFEILKSEDVEERLNIMNDEINPDLLVMTTGKRKFFDRIFDESLTKKMFYHTEIPLLVFSEK